MLDAYLRDWFSVMLAGIGVSFAPNIWFGGLILAVAGASIAFHHDPERDMRERWVVYTTALVTAHMVAMFFFWWKPDLPPQFVMFFAGFLSRKVIRSALRIASLIEAQGNTIAARIVDRVLPGAYRYGDSSPPEETTNTDEEV